MTINDKKSFLLYGNYETQFKLLSMEERGLLITAIFEYSNNGAVQTPLSPLVELAFSFVKENLDRDHENYLDRCEKNSENGKKGGRPKKNAKDAHFYSSPEKENISMSKTERFFEKPKKADNDNGNDNGNENENEIDNESVIENGMMEKEKENEKGEFPSSSVSDSAASSDSSAALSETEKEELIKKGLSRSYIEERAERASLYAKERGSNAFSVLERWWSEDQAAQKQKRSRYGEKHGQVPATAGVHISGRSYDINEFALAAIQSSERFMDAELGIASG